MGAGAGRSAGDGRVQHAILEFDSFGNLGWSVGIEALCRIAEHERDLAKYVADLRAQEGQNGDGRNGDENQDQGILH